MLRQRVSVICPILLCCMLLLVACSGNTAPTSSTASPTASHQPTVSATPTPTRTPTAQPTPVATTTTPQHYTAHTLLRGVGRPDDLVFDTQGRLLFSDFYNGTLSRVNANGTVTVLYQNIAGPEGLVVLKDGTLIVAEQRTNRIITFAPGATSPTTLRALPGTPSTAQCKDGVDGIAFDSTNNTLIVPDSPTGEVYRMSLDGKTLTLLASGIVRPVGAAVDAHGTIYVADECGGALWRIAPSGQKERIGGFGMLDDVVLDTHGNVLVTDLLPSIHALIRMNIASGKRETLASAGFIEPQGLLIDGRDNIFISDDYANSIVEYTPS